MNLKDRPSGWPLWLWIIVLIAVKKEDRLPLVEPSKLSKLARAISLKLKDAYAFNREWRDRALSAENALAATARSCKQIIREHDAKFSTIIAWRD